jgi:hypothetical protein
MLGDQLLAMKNFRALDDKKRKNVKNLPVFGIVRQHTFSRNICSFFNEMHFKLNYDQVFNDNDI